MQVLTSGMQIFQALKHSSFSVVSAKLGDIKHCMFCMLGNLKLYHFVLFMNYTESFIFHKMFDDACHS